MNRAVLKKCLAEARLLFAATAALLFSFCWVRVFIVSTLETSDFAGIVERLWDKWGHFSPVSLSHLLSYTGRVALAYDEPIVVFGVSIFAIARGSDAVSGELNRGTMELLLAQPVSRLQVLYSQALVTVSCLLLICTATWCGTWTGIQTNSVTERVPPSKLKIPALGFDIPLSFGEREKIKVPMRERVEPRNFIPGAVNLFCMGFGLAGLSTLASSFDRYRWRTIGIVSGFFVIMLICKIVGLAIPRFSWLKQCSFFTPYEPQKYIAIAVTDPANAWSVAMYDSSGRFVDLGPLGYNLILLGIGLAAYLTAGIVFHRRDLPAPL